MVSVLLSIGPEGHPGQEHERHCLEPVPFLERLNQGHAKKRGTKIARPGSSSEFFVAAIFRTSSCPTNYHLQSTMGHRAWRSRICSFQLLNERRWAARAGPPVLPGSLLPLEICPSLTYSLLTVRSRGLPHRDPTTAANQKVIPTPGPRGFQDQRRVDGASQTERARCHCLPLLPTSTFDVCRDKRHRVTDGKRLPRFSVVALTQRNNVPTNVG